MISAESSSVEHAFDHILQTHNTILNVQLQKYEQSDWLVGKQYSSTCILHGPYCQYLVGHIKQETIATIG